MCVCGAWLWRADSSYHEATDGPQVHTHGTAIRTTHTTHTAHAHTCMPAALALDALASTVCLVIRARTERSQSPCAAWSYCCCCSTLISFWGVESDVDVDDDDRLDGRLERWKGRTRSASPLMDKRATSQRR